MNNVMVLCLGFVTIIYYRQATLELKKGREVERASSCSAWIGMAVPLCWLRLLLFFQLTCVHWWSWFLLCLPEKAGKMVR